jgi:hypothetical protein
MLKFNAAVYTTERDWMQFAKKSHVSNAAATWNQYCEQLPESDQT